MRVLITGGCGFIGSHLVHLLLERHPEAEVVNIDLLTYAGNPANVADLEDDPRYTFVRGDIADADTVARAVAGCTHVINVAAESHVDRSIHGATHFIRTAVLGTYVLLEAARAAGTVERFLQVSTDEVYGSIAEGEFDEAAVLTPRSPYSASKAGSDLQALAYMTTHGLPVVVTRGSNTYGPNQYPEKLIPLFTTNALDGQPLPQYGEGRQVRDWLHVRDHAGGILHMLEHGTAGEVYNIGGGNERENHWIVERILRHTGASPDLVRIVPDREGHDFRYAIATDKARALGWAPQVELEQGLEETIAWYAATRTWWEPIKNGEFRDFYEQQYRERLEAGVPAG